MNPKIDSNAIMAEIRANTAQLDGCVKPHNFSVDASPDKPLFKKWQCSKCGGKVDAINKIWYERGLRDVGAEAYRLRKQVTELEGRIANALL